MKKIKKFIKRQQSKLLSLLFIVVGSVFFLIRLDFKHQDTPRIIRSEVDNINCEIKITTNEGEKIAKTNFAELKLNEKCNDFIVRKIAPSGKYFAYQDISGGVDSMLKIYALDYDQTFQLDVVGTSTIFDLAFIDNNKLIVLLGYKDIFDEQFLKIYDLPKLFSDYPKNLNQEYHYFENLNKYSKTITLPNVQQNYASLFIEGNTLNIYGEKGHNSAVLKQYSFAELMK